MNNHWRTTATHIASILQSCIAHKSHLAGKASHAHILRLGFSDDIFLFNRLIELYSKCGSLRHASNLFDKMPHKNIYSWNAVLSVHCKAGNLELALKMFEEMPERNVVSWNTVISASAQSGSEGVALHLYDEMICQGFLPTHFTFASVLSACRNMGDLVHGRRCHGLVVKVGLDGNSFVENALVGMYTKCGCMNEAFLIFDTMSCPNEVSFTAMMSGLAQCGLVTEALKLFVKMHWSGVSIDPVAVSSVLGACAKVKEEEASVSCEYCRLHGIPFAQSIHALLVKAGFDSDTYVGNSLIDMYVKYGQMDQAELAFQTLPGINVVSWNVLIAGYSQKGESRKALNLVKQMQFLGYEPDDVTYVSQLMACVNSGDLETAYHTFLKISDPGACIWNTLLSGYNQEEDHKKTLILFRHMQLSGTCPDRTTLAIVLSSCSGMGLLNFGKEIHCASIRLVLHMDMFVESALVDMYSKSGHIEAARQVFDKMFERDVVSWNSMISGLAIQSSNKEAFTFFREMRVNGLCPTGFSYASVVSSCARLSCLAEGREIHAQTEKDGFVCDVFVGSALIDLYSKCGNIEEARKFFDSMPTRNVVSWNEMIHGYAQNGTGNMAVELYRNMIGSEKPDSVTFICALTACSHSGMVDEGLEIFHSMEKVHGIKPMADHYTCIIDALGRAGRFKEIEDVIDRMPCKDDPIIWEVLLSACRMHGNISLGKLAADHLFHHDPRNSSPYVLMSNIYAESERWGDASAVRKLMTNRGVVKDRGYSWIDDKEGVHAFMVDDLGNHGLSLKGESLSNF